MPTRHPRLPFAGFIAHLRRLGFIVGVDHHLHLHALLEQLGPQHKPDDLKTLLCPLFATDKEQQRQFHAAFDSYFKHWRQAREQAEHISREQTAEIAPGAGPVTEKRNWRIKLVLALLLWAVALGLGRRAWEQMQPPPPPTKPTTCAEYKQQGLPLPARCEADKPPAPKAEEIQPEDQNLRRTPRYSDVLKENGGKSDNILISLLYRYGNQLRWLLIALPLTIWLVLELRAWRRRKLAVLHQRGRRPPRFWPLQVTPPTPAFLRGSAFFDAARGLHRRRTGGHRVLDIPATVERGIERLGYTEPRYRAMRHLPEYLILIDLSHGRDHHSHFADTLVQALAGEDLHINAWFFQRNPRICFRRPGAERVAFADLQARYDGSRLILIGDGEGLRRPHDGKLEDWVELFHAWPQRALLTPRPAGQWGAREVALGAEFILLPAGLAGLNAVVDFFEAQRGDSPRAWKKRDRLSAPPLPMVREEDELSAVALADLRAWLDDEALFQWLCACAVYPELHWNLTLHLAGLDCLPRQLLTEARLLKLLRLPWFRDGRIPDPWRWALLRELDPAIARGVRSALIELLENNPPPEGSEAWDHYRLNLAVQRHLLFKRHTWRGLRDTLHAWREARARRRELKQQLKRLPPTPATEDYALLKLLEGTSSPLVLLLPAALRKRLFRHGVPLLGLHAWVRGGMTLLLTLGLWFIPVVTPPIDSWERQPIVENPADLPSLTVFRDRLPSGGVGPEMVALPEGQFMMGSPESEEGRDSDEGPQHQVILSAFAIERYEVTVGEFRRFVDYTGYRTEAELGEGCRIWTGSEWEYRKETYWDKPGFEQSDDHPVVCVSWNDAQAYATWLSEQTGYVYRLPTEAEWEYAARAGTITAYSFGDNVSDLGDYAWYYRNSNNQTHPVGTKKANPWKLYDAHGNAWEWTADWFDNYSDIAKDNPAGPEQGSARVGRGGTWLSTPRGVRSALRKRDPADSYYTLGFRLARTNARHSYPSAQIRTYTPYQPFSDDLQQGGAGPEMLYIPGGTFMMGSPDSEVGRSDDEGPQHQVTLGDFFIGRDEVTFAQYDAFCEATGRDKPGDAGWGRGERPIINVSWEDAQAYAVWLTAQTGGRFIYRLPTEAEWEYAARAETTTAYWWGDDIGQANTNCDGDCGDNFEYTAPVGSFDANAWGLRDTVGNVWEWVQDWYVDSYPATAQKNPVGPDEGSRWILRARRVRRGGAWGSYPRSVRSARRAWAVPDYRNHYVGFRLARTDPWPFYTSLRAEKPEMVAFAQSVTFKMGSDSGTDDEKPVHDVTLSPFEIGKYEVTVGEFRRFVEASGYKTEAEKEDGCFGWTGSGSKQRKEFTWRNPGFAQQDNHPVACVSWNDAKAYIDWLNAELNTDYRLPTEAEWEYAARGGTSTEYWWGDKASHEYANYGTDGCCRPLAEGKDKWKFTGPAESFPANPFSLYDTAGNVYEWVEDWYENYPTEAQSDPTGPEKGTARVNRGGAWTSYPRYVRSAYRDGVGPAYRLARTVP